LQLDIITPKAKTPQITLKKHMSSPPASGIDTGGASQSTAEGYKATYQTFKLEPPKKFEKVHSAQTISRVLRLHPEHRALGRFDNPAFRFLEPNVVGIRDLNPILTRVTRIKEHEISGLIDIEESPERLFFEICKKTQFKEALKQRFNHYENKEGVFFAIDVDIVELRPDDVNKDWFPQLAAALQETTVKIHVRRNSRSIGDIRGLYDYLEVSSLTAVALVMKAYGDLRAFTSVVAFGPDTFAGDVHRRKLGAALGTTATQFLLASMFEAMSKRNYEMTDPLIGPVTDLLAAHLSRDDHHRLIISSSDSDSEHVRNRLGNLIDIHCPRKTHMNLDNYCKMAAIRDGVVYGAMRDDAKSVDAHNQDHVDMLNAFADAIIGISSTATNATAPLAGEAVRNAGTIGKMLVSRGVGHRWVKGAVDAAITDLFTLDVERGVERGKIRGLTLDKPSDDEKKLLQRYSGDARAIMNFASSRIPP